MTIINPPPIAVWYDTKDDYFPPIGQRVITSNNDIGYFSGNYKFISEISEEVYEDVIWTFLPFYSKPHNEYL